MIPNLKLLSKKWPSLSTAGLTCHQLRNTSKGLSTPHSESRPSDLSTDSPCWGWVEVQAPFVIARRSWHHTELHHPSPLETVVSEKSATKGILRGLWIVWGYFSWGGLYPMNYKSVFSTYSFLLKLQADFLSWLFKCISKREKNLNLDQISGIGSKERICALPKPYLITFQN